MSQTLNKIKETLESIRPYVQRDGGDLEFVKFENKIVYIRLKGNCVGCSLSDITVKGGIEQIMVEEFPEEVTAVELIKDADWESKKHTMFE